VPGGTLLVEPQAGYGVVDRFVAGATRSVDVTMYELADPVFEQALAEDAARGVAVRVLLDSAYHGGEVNQEADTWLTSHGVAVRWANSSEIFHQKTITVDGTESLIATFNLVSRYEATSRNFGYFDADPADVAAIVATFDQDWTGAPPGPAPSGSGDLIWSPGATSRLVALIGSATGSLDVECEELSDPSILDALLAAAERHVQVRVVAEADPGLSSALGELVAAGAKVVTYPATGPLYIHAKLLVVNGSVLWIGSENFSVASLVDNRELGVVISDPSVVQQAAQVFSSDFAGGLPFGPGT